MRMYVTPPPEGVGSSNFHSTAPDALSLSTWGGNESNVTRTPPSEVALIACGVVDTSISMGSSRSRVNAPLDATTLGDLVVAEESAYVALQSGPKKIISVTRCNGCVPVLSVVVRSMTEYRLLPSSVSVLRPVATTPFFMQLKSLKVVLPLWTVLSWLHCPAWGTRLAAAIRAGVKHRRCGSSFLKSGAWLTILLLN